MIQFGVTTIRKSVKAATETRRMPFVFIRKLALWLALYSLGLSRSVSARLGQSRLSRLSQKNDPELCSRDF